VVITEESYTSVASFLDRDPLPVWKPNNETEYTFSGRRVKRGLYRASGKRYINSDVNGSLNRIRKVAPNAFGPEGVEDGKAVLAPMARPCSADSRSPAKTSKRNL